MKLSEIPFVSKHKPENLAKAKVWLKENSLSFGNTANFAVILDNGEVSQYINQQCHYYIGYQGSGGNRDVVATEIGAFRKYKGTIPPAIAHYIKWFVERSFASRFILNKDDLEECMKLGIVVSTDIPAPFFQNIMIASRHPYEVNIATFELFESLLNKGYDDNLAFTICFNGSVADKEHQGTGIVGKYQPGHRISRVMPSMQNVGLSLIHI